MSPLYPRYRPRTVGDAAGFGKAPLAPVAVAGTGNGLHLALARSGDWIGPELQLDMELAKAATKYWLLRLVLDSAL